MGIKNSENSWRAWGTEKHGTGTRVAVHKASLGSAEFASLSCALTLSDLDYLHKPQCCLCPTLLLHFLARPISLYLVLDESFG